VIGEDKVGLGLRKENNSFGRNGLRVILFFRYLKVYALSLNVRHSNHKAKDDLRG